MNAQEFKVRFETLYQSGGRTLSSAPLDDYEISVFLTDAQMMLIKQHYNPYGNTYQEGFERSEKRRREFSELVRNNSSAPPFTDNTLQIGDSTSLLFNLPQDVMFIVQEKALVRSQNPCYNGTYVDIKPITHDRYNSHKKNPFRKPDPEIIWRMDLGDNNNDNTRGIVELIFDPIIFPIRYDCRYVKKPSPIIVSDVSLIDPTLTIEGITGPSESDISDEFHEEIVKLAVSLAWGYQGNPLTQVGIGLARAAE